MLVVVTADKTRSKTQAAVCKVSDLKMKAEARISPSLL